MTFKLKAIDIAKNYLQDGLFVNIPPNKLSAATNSFPIDRTDDIFCLIDCTVFKSCKNGMAFGLKGIYWKNDWTTDSHDSFLSWDELIEFKEYIHTKSWDLVLSPGNPVNFSGSSVKKNNAMNLTLELITAYEETATSAPSFDNALPQYIIAILKSAAIYASQEEINEDIVDLCIEYIKFEDQIFDKEEAISILQANIEVLFKTSGVMKKLQTNKILAEIQKHSYTEEEVLQIKILLQEFQSLTSNKNLLIDI